MNICAIAGRLARNGVVKGTEKKVLMFTVETRSGGEDGDNKNERVSFVPCIVFNPSPELERKLVTDGKGLYVELEGRINWSSYEVNGERKFQTEVVVFNRSITIPQN